jgi:uncharacterized membrane protein required for colicin V production
MLLGFFTVVIMLIVTYAFWRQGVLAAFVTCCNILGAGMVAFNFFEPIAAELDPMVADSFLHGYEDSICLILLFSLTLGFLRWITNAAIHTTIEYNRGIQQGGAVLFGLTAGYLISGFLICVAQTLPLGEHFMQFEARIDPQSPGAKVRHVMPPDRTWLALMQRASDAAFSWGDPPDLFDSDGSFEMRYDRERRIADQE